MNWATARLSTRRNLEVGIGIAPQPRQTGEPIFCVNQLAGASVFFRSQDADGPSKFRAGDLPPHGARGDLDLGVVADALALAQFAVRHEIEFVPVFGKPNRRVDGNAALAEGREADVALALDFCGNGCHADIVMRRGRIAPTCTAVST